MFASSRSRKDMRASENYNSHTLRTMRTFEFGCDLSLSREGLLVIHDRYRLCSRLLAYLTFPEDLDRRYQFLATREALFLQHEFDRWDKAERECAHLHPDANDGLAAPDRNRQQHRAVDITRLIFAHFRTFGGGFGPLAAAAYDKPLGKLLERELDAALLCGYRLLLTAAMAANHSDVLRSGASLGKATALVAQIFEKSEKTIKAAWSSHHSVAHLAAAAVYIALKERESNCTAEEPTIRSILEHTEDLLQLTQDFFAFAIAFRAHHSSSIKLDGDALWRLPFSLPSRSLKPHLWPLSKEQLAYLHVERWAPAPPE